MILWVRSQRPKPLRNPKLALPKLAKRVALQELVLQLEASKQEKSPSYLGGQILATFHAPKLSQIAKFKTNNPRIGKSLRTFHHQSPLDFPTK